MPQAAQICGEHLPDVHPSMETALPEICTSIYLTNGTYAAGAHMSYLSKIALTLAVCCSFSPATFGQSSDSTALGARIAQRNSLVPQSGTFTLSNVKVPDCAAFDSYGSTSDDDKN